MDNVSKNSLINFRIKDVSIDGNGVGVCEENGMTVFCFGGEIGENVCGTVIRKAPNYLIAKSNRKAVSEHCSAYPVCGGCSLLHFPYARTLEIKQNHVRDCLERIGGFKGIKIDQIIGSPEIQYFRNKAIYRFIKTSEGIRCGFFRRNSHDVIPSESCFCEKPLCREICSAFLKAANERHMSVYNEQASRGLLRALMVRVSVTGEAMVCVSVNSKDLPDAPAIASTLMKEIPSISSFYVHSNTSKTNNVLQGDFKLIAGSKTLTDSIGGATFEISPESFFQVNPYATVKLYDKAFEYALIDQKEPVTLLDLYCGIGTIGIYFAKKCGIIKEILGIDYTGAAIAEADRAAQVNGISAKCRFIAGDAEELFGDSFDTLPADAKAIAKRATTLVVDPPRKGLGDKMPGIISSLGLDRIVYVSCNPATLARDLARFRELGWNVEKVTPVDMFPFEGHVETCCLLSRKDVNKRSYVSLDVEMEDYYRIKNETEVTTDATE